MGSTKEVYYYIRDQHGHPRITVCLLHNFDTEKTYRGVAIAMTEMPIKSDGKNRAAGRAWKAYYSGNRADPIQNPEVADFVINQVWRLNMRQLWNAYIYKSNPDVDIEAFEGELIRKVGPPV